MTEDAPEPQVRPVLRALAGIASAFLVSAGIALVVCGLLNGCWLMAFYGCCGFGVSFGFGLVAFRGRGLESRSRQFACRSLRTSDREMTYAQDTES